MGTRTYFLLEMEELFVSEYVKDFNATQAAIRAGYAKRTAKQQGHKLLRRPEVAEAIGRLTNRVLARNEVNASRVVAWLLERAELDAGEMFGEDGELLPVKAMPEHVRRCVESYEMTKFGPKVKLQPRQGAIDALAKYHQLFVEKMQVEHTGGISIHIDLGAAREPPQSDG